MPKIWNSPFSLGSKVLCQCPCTLELTWTCIQFSLAAHAPRFPIVHGLASRGQCKEALPISIKALFSLYFLPFASSSFNHSLPPWFHLFISNPSPPLLASPSLAKYLGWNLLGCMPQETSPRAIWGKTMFFLPLLCVCGCCSYACLLVTFFGICHM